MYIKKRLTPEHSGFPQASYRFCLKCWNLGGATTQNWDWTKLQLFGYNFKTKIKQSFAEISDFKECLERLAFNSTTIVFFFLASFVRVIFFMRNVNARLSRSLSLKSDLLHTSICVHLKIDLHQNILIDNVH
jgi:hypothetical protein